MTAGTATLGLLPLLVLQLHGTEIERPLAVVMIGGLVTSTLFTLLVLPTFYLQVHGWLERRAAEAGLKTRNYVLSDTTTGPCRAGAPSRGRCGPSHSIASCQLPAMLKSVAIS